MNTFKLFAIIATLLLFPRFSAAAEKHRGPDYDPKRLIQEVKDSIKDARVAQEDLQARLAEQKQKTAEARQGSEELLAKNAGLAKELDAEKAKRADIEAKLGQFALQLDELAKQRQLLNQQVAVGKKARESFAAELKGQEEKLSLMQEMLREEVGEKIKATDDLERLKMEKQKMDLKVGVLLDSEQKSRELQRSLDLIQAENSYVLAELARINELLKPFKKNNN